MDEVLDSAQSGGPEGVDFDAIVGVDPLDLSDEQRRHWLRHGHRLMARLDAATVAITGAFDANLDWAADGAKSAASWISGRSPIAHARASSDVHTARTLRDTPKVAEAAREGRISRDHVAALLKARRGGLEEAFAVCEQILVDEVAECTVAAAHTFLRRWAHDTRARLGINEPDGTKPDRDSEHSIVHLSPTYGGKWDLQGVLDPETGEILANALDHQMDAMWRAGVFHVDDGLCQPERRGKALAELICRATRDGDQDGTARPLVLGIITVDPDTDLPDDQLDADPEDHAGDTLDDGVDDGDAHDIGAERATVGGGPTDPLHAVRQRVLAGLDGDLRDDVDDALCNFPTQLRIAELSRAGPTSAIALHKWVCEGDVVPVTVTPDGDVLRMGRAIRVANRHQRRSLRVRDGGCQFPGCTVAAEYCVPHHIAFWELGGPTDLENLVLLCRFHHDAVHKRGFTFTRDVDGAWDVRRPGRGTVTPHLRIRPELIPRPRPSPDELLMRRLARQRINALIEHGPPEWPRDEHGNRLPLVAASR